jgi:hypothetical protein
MNILKALFATLAFVGVVILAIVLGTKKEKEVIDNYVDNSAPTSLAAAPASDQVGPLAVLAQKEPEPKNVAGPTSKAAPPVNKTTAPEKTSATEAQAPKPVQKPGDGTPANEVSPENTCEYYMSTLTKEEQEKLKLTFKCSGIDPEKATGNEKIFIESLKVPNLEKEKKELEKKVSNLTLAKTTAEATAKQAKKDAEQTVAAAEKKAKDKVAYIETTTKKEIEKKDKKIGELESQVSILSNKAPEKICYETVEVFFEGQIKKDGKIQKFPFKGYQQVEVSCDKKPTQPPLPPGATVVPAAPKK